MEVSKRWYLGGGKRGELRLRNIQKLADRLFNGNVSRLVNDAIDRLYHLDRETGKRLKSPKNTGPSKRYNVDPATGRPIAPQPPEDYQD